MSRNFSFIGYLFGRKRDDNKSGKTLKLLSDKNIRKLRSVLNINITDKTLYTRALIHRSFLEINDNIELSNERLEFLGDSVLSLTVAEFLFKNFPEEDEGFLTKIRAKFVNRDSLGEAAESIGLGDFILIGNNLTRSFIKNSKTVLSDTFEALIGAIYLDQGLKECKKFVYRIVIEPNMRNDEYLIDENYKSQLLEYAQANKFQIPTYKVVNEEGPQHNRIFTVIVLMGDESMGAGKGKTKKTAEQNAARVALRKLIAKEPHSED
ncbi:ribonuclease 3 [bacterium BMS3Abin03]|nr:ribonuclease 3 [bacterium BMS3Abin03]